MIQQIAPAIAVIGQALDSLAESPLFTLEEKRNIVQSNISCQEKGEVQWHQGEELFKYLKNVSVSIKSRRFSAIPPEISKQCHVTAVSKKKLL